MPNLGRETGGYHEVKFEKDQKRRPKGSKEGGQFAPEGGGGKGGDKGGPETQSSLRRHRLAAPGILGNLPGGMDSVKGAVMDGLKAATETKDPKKAYKALSQSADALLSLKESGRWSAEAAALSRGIRMQMAAIKGSGL